MTTTQRWVLMATAEAINEFAQRDVLSEFLRAMFGFVAISEVFSHSRTGFWSGMPPKRPKTSPFPAVLTTYSRWKIESHYLGKCAETSEIVSKT